MELIKTILVDDEPGNIITLQELLKNYCSYISVVGIAENIDAAAALIQSERPDLVMLDIEMPYGNGFDLLEQLSPANFEVVFVTAFDNYAVRAFKYAAIDYILKPVNIQELQEAVDKVRMRLTEKQVNNKIELLLSTIKSGQGDIKKIAFPTGDGLVFEAVDNILFIEASGSYTTVHLTGGHKYLVTKKISDIEQVLPAIIFFRVHNSFIINTHKIRKYQKGRGGFVVMENGASIEVSTRKRDEFLERFQL
jgi:two-component system, LytTR family, response regulator